MKPIGNKILIKRDSADEMTQAGTIIPEEIQDKATGTGVVVAIGSRDIPPEIKEGSRIIFDKYAGDSVKLDGHEHIVMRPFNIVGVFQ